MKKSIEKCFSFVNLFVFTLKYPKENFIIYWNIIYLQSTFRISVSAWLVPQYCHFYKRTSVIHVISELDSRNRVLYFVLFLFSFSNLHQWEMPHFLSCSFLALVPLLETFVSGSVAIIFSLQQCLCNYFDIFLNVLFYK